MSIKTFPYCYFCGWTEKDTKKSVKDISLCPNCRHSNDLYDRPIKGYQHGDAFYIIRIVGAKKHHWFFEFSGSNKRFHAIKHDKNMYRVTGWNYTGSLECPRNTGVIPNRYVKMLEIIDPELKTKHTFVEAVLLTLSSIDMIYDWIDYWHTNKDCSDIPLMDFLGLSPEEYGAWVEDSKALENIIKTKMINSTPEGDVKSGI